MDFMVVMRVFGLSNTDGPHFLASRAVFFVSPRVIRRCRRATTRSAALLTDLFGDEDRRQVRRRSLHRS